jgi:hemolysin activation/secretion protein
VTEPAEQPASATPAKQSEPKAVRAAAHEIARSEPAAPKTPNAQVTQPSTQQPKDEPDDEEEPFDAREAAHAVDEAAERASSCRREADPSGVAVVTITFAPSGRVTTATLAGPPFIGTPTGSCIASTMRSARVSAFSGKHMTVRKTVTIH